MTDSTQAQAPAPEPEDDGLRLTEIEAQYLQDDGYDADGHLSHNKPGDIIRELIHEIRNTRGAIRLAQATFVSRAEMEKKIEVAKHEAKTERKKAERRLHRMIGSIAATVIVLAGSMGFAAWAYLTSTHQYRVSQYQTCVARNLQYTQALNQQQQSVQFVRKFIEIESKSQDHETAAAIINLLRQAQTEGSTQSEAPPPKCDALKP